MALTVKNWARHQHFTRRRPTWIKLHYKLLDDGDFGELPVESRALLPMIWLLASEAPDGQIRMSNKDIARRIHWPLGAYLTALEPLFDALFVDLDPESVADFENSDMKAIGIIEKYGLRAKNPAVRLNKPSESQRVRDTERQNLSRETESLSRANKQNGEDQISGQSGGLFEDDASLGDATALAVEFWNDMSGKVGLPGKVQRLTGPRRAKVLARLRELGGLEGWKDLLARVAASDFLCGRKEGSDWQVPFDFVLKPMNVAKIMEGNYDNKKSNGGQVAGEKRSKIAHAIDVLERSKIERRAREQRQADLGETGDPAGERRAAPFDDLD